ncbi:MAG: 5-methylthioadenosine/S-adenosylhomocysteine deaminase, partial [Thermoleophilaceae bacterium]|nr:5-methylthioadenosine/S-adenosylhomocysteine deaminase [Thermoleophilaceae bacterium]
IQDVTPAGGGQGARDGRLASRSLEQSLDMLGGQLKRNRDPDALVRGHVALIGMGTATDELALAAKALADREGVVLNQHQSCEHADAAADDTRMGRHPLVHQEEIGLLGANCTFAHMNVLREDELDPIVRSGLSIAWCPAASMIWGFGGTFRGHHAALHARGANIALGCDISNFANSFDIGQEAYLAVLTAREQHQRRDILDAGDALAMATINGARAVGLEHMIGSIEPGKRADLVIRALDVPEQFPLNNMITELVYSSGAKSIHSVVVDGRVVLEERQPTRVDAVSVYRRAERAARATLDRGARDGAPAWPLLDRVRSAR